MHVTVNSQLLATELRLLNKIVPSKPAIAILSHALLTASDGLHLYATDLEVGLSASCQASIIESGQVALPVAKLLALVEQFTDGDVVISTEGAKVNVRCGAFKSKLQAMPTNDFPQPALVEGTSTTIDAGALRQLIARTRYAINATSAKFVLQGALLTMQGPVAAMIATDSKRLALATASRFGPDIRITIPAKTLDALASGPDSDIEITVGDRHLFFAQGERLLTSRMLDGKFPEYQRIIPRDNNKIVTVDRPALIAVLRRIILVAENNSAVYLDIAPGRMELSSASAEVGSANEDVAVQYDGEPLKVCVNGSYVLDFLEAASGTVTMALKDAMSAMLLTDGDDHVGVVMLMRGT